MKAIKKKGIILFDGVCNFCSWSIQFIIKHDQKHHFVFTALQSDVAKEILLHYPEDITKKDSILLIQNKTIYTESDAFLQIITHFPLGWKILLVFWIIPKSIRDTVYSYIAKNRYKWFGQKDTCMIPSKEIKKRFL